MTDGITTTELSKVFPGASSPALDKLSVSVRPGEVYGYLGANGAGKSTTIRLLMNFIQPTSGSATIGGFDIVKDSVRIKQQIGYLSGDVALYAKTTGRELLDYLDTMQGGSSKTYRAELERRFEAETGKPIAELSKGNRQKIGIIQALMHQPAVLILDEPTAGLDPLMQEVFYDSIREARDRGAAVLMSSHNLVEAQTLCDRIGILKQGKLIREQAVAAVSSLEMPALRLEFGDRSELHKLKKFRHVVILSQDDLVAVVQPKGTIAQALRELSTLDIRNIRSEQVDLEDEFLEFYGSEQ